MRILRTLAAAALLALAAAPAAAQAPLGGRDGYLGGGPLLAVRPQNHQLLVRAVREAGYDPQRLRPAEQQALRSAWSRLFPEADPRTYTLNPAQATALVYIALVYPRDGGRGGWNDDRGGWNGRDPYRDRDDRDGYGQGGYGRDGYGQGGYGRGQCRDLDRQVYAMQDAVNPDGAGLFVGGEQKQEIRTAAREVQRLAIDRGMRRVADRAADVVASVAATLPDRRDVNARIDALKSSLDDACGGR